MEKKKKVIAAGHICLDITPVFPEKHHNSVSEILIPGKLLHMHGVTVATGGSAANTGLGLKILGADVKILGKVGEDSLGWLIGKKLSEYGVTEGLIYDSSASTSYTVAVAIPGIDRFFLHDCGANDTYVSDDIKDEDLDGAELFHFGYPSLMKSFYEQEGQEMIKLFKRVRERNIPVSLDMAAVDPDSDAGKVNWKKYLQDVLPLTDIFLPSIEELLYMTDTEKYWDLIEKAAGGDILSVIDIERDVRPVAQQLIDLGVKIVLIKCGTLGLYLKTSSHEYLEPLMKEMDLDCSQWADKEIYTTCYKPERIASGTGAGDTCISAFLMALLQGETPENCLELAAAEGASCVEGYDALSGLRTLEELKEKIAAGWEKA